MVKPEVRTSGTVEEIPHKLFYKIGEVSRLTSLEPYVLRYWETEFPFLKPRKGKSKQRMYQKKDIEALLEIKRLLYVERLTIEGVRKRLAKKYLDVLKENVQKPEPVAVAIEQDHDHDKEHSTKQAVEMVKERLTVLLGMLKHNGA